jgi:peptidoglycan/LPS O-acetylase OafA/YrhL
MTISQQTHTRLAHLDGLRGLAALLVLYQHLVEYCAAAAPADAWAQAHLAWLFGYLDLGKVGVVAFFAISGFIVPFSFGASQARTGFVLSRVFRLYPAYWLSLLLAAWLLPQLGEIDFSAVQLVANTTMLQTAFRQPNVLDVYWTLFIELVFYAMCLAVFSAGRLGSAKAIFCIFSALLVAAMGGAVARHAGQPGIPAALPLYLAVMWFAACLRLAVLHGDAQARQLCRVMLPMLLLAIPAVWATAYDDNSHKESVLADISAFYLALLLFLGCVKRRWFTPGWLVYVGGISYSLYLFHPLMLELGAYWARPLAWPVSGLVQVVATLVLSFLLSHAVYRWVERPAVRLGKQLVHRLGAGQRRAGLRMPAP